MTSSVGLLAVYKTPLWSKPHAQMNRNLASRTIGMNATTVSILLIAVFSQAATMNILQYWTLALSAIIILPAASMDAITE